MTTGRVHVVCDLCKKEVSFPATDAGSTQECPQCRAYVDVPDSSTALVDPNRQAERYQEQVNEVDRQNEVVRRQMEQYQRQLDSSDRQNESTRRQIEQYQRQLDEGEEILQTKKKEASQMSAMVERWNGLAERFEKLLDHWGKE